MTYITGGNIEATDYNAFSTLATGMNEIFADTNLGATNLPAAGFGYGQPALTSVIAGQVVGAVEWAALFQTIRKCGTHQEGNQSTVVPPLPPAGVVPGQLDANGNPISGATIIAYNTPSLQTTINNLGLDVNRFKLALGQYSIVNMAGTPVAAPSWTNTLTYTFTANFGSWNNARYFFNAGGAIYISGAHPNGSGDDAEWYGMLQSMSPLVFNYNATTPLVGAPGPNGGFWNVTVPLTIAYQTKYTQTYSLSPYSGSYIQVSAKLGAAAGSPGSEVITFQVYFFQVDSGTIISPKSGTTMTPAYRYSSGVIPVAQPTLTSTGPGLGFVAN